MARLKVGNLDIHYQIDDFTDLWAESDVVLSHHGYCRNIKFWNSWVPSIARKYQVSWFYVWGDHRSPERVCLVS